MRQPQGDIINAITDLLVVVDSKRKIIEANAAACLFLGYDKKDLIGRKLESILAGAEDSPLRGGKLEKVIGTGTIMNVEALCLKSDGSKMPILFSSSVVKSASAEPERIVCTAKDITDLKKTEQKIQQAYDELKAAQSQLIQAEKMEAVGRMASGVAHEVKNPLATIIQGVNYLEGEIPPGHNDKTDMIKLIKKNVKRADNIIRSLLDFSRSSKLYTKPEDINSIIEDSLALIHHKVKIEGVEIVREMGKRLPKVSADAGKAEQVFINIFLNAIHAMPRGGKLFIRTYVSASGCSGKDRFIASEVKDTGSGIPQEHIGNIFDPFFTTKGPREGTGLGLSVTKNIIDMHKGRIKVKSRVNKGTSVTVFFKVAKGGE